MAKGMMRLEAGEVVTTLDHLHARISERFPASGLSRVCARLTATARETAKRARRLSRPYLALTAKLAALYAGENDDPAILAAVNDIETLTSDLGRKIWQKIMILGQLDEAKA